MFSAWHTRIICSRHLTRKTLHKMGGNVSAGCDNPKTGKIVAKISESEYVIYPGTMPVDEKNYVVIFDSHRPTVIQVNKEAYKQYEVGQIYGSGKYYDR